MVVARAAAVGTVAVLPFSNVGGGAQDEYFSEGMTDELARALSRLPSIRVAARSSAYAFRGKAMSGQDIERTLNVAAQIIFSRRLLATQTMRWRTLGSPIPMR